MFEVMTLEEMNVQTIYQVFEDAFTDYFVAIEKNSQLHINRWLSMGVDFELSYGVKSQGLLVACLLHSPRKEMIMNLATGVRKDFQGKGLSTLLYQRILKDIPAKGFRQMQLEVITENDRAIHAYEKAGFIKQRKLLCWKGTANAFEGSMGDHRVLKAELTLQHSQLSPYPYAFEMDKTAVMRHADSLELHELRDGEKLLAFAIWNPWKMNLMQLGGINRTAAETLLAKMKLSGQSFGMVNVDERNDLVNGILRDHNLKNYISQYEMVRFF
jgi:GNAT superfamily N-acetyltransferase